MKFSPREARHAGDAEGVEEISPGLPDSERATPGPNPLNRSLSREARRAKRVSLTPTEPFILNGTLRPKQYRVLASPESPAFFWTSTPSPLSFLSNTILHYETRAPVRNHS